MTIIGAKAQMPARNRPYRWLPRLLLRVCLLTLLAGCAATSATVIEEEKVVNTKPMFRYTTLLVRDFELTRDVPPLETAAPAGGRAEKIHYGQLPGELSTHIVRYVTAHRIYRGVVRDGTPDAATLVLTGKFIRIGRFKISVEATLRDGATGLEVASFRQTLWDVIDTTASFGELGRELADFIYRIQYK